MKIRRPYRFMEGIEKKLTESMEQLIESSRDGILAEAGNRINIDNRVRGGKVQRRKRVSGRDGYTVRDGKLTRMSPEERRNRHRSQVKGARKRRGKNAQANRNRKISMRKRSRFTS